MDDDIFEVYARELLVKERYRSRPWRREGRILPRRRLDQIERIPWWDDFWYQPYWDARTWRDAEAKVSPVGGSRHYGGPGLGEAVSWKCPACGADNTGPLGQGCQLCGSGKPGFKAAAAPVPTPAVDDEREKYDAAYRAGYQAGYEAGLRAAKQPTNPVFTPEGKVARTMIAALALFAEQVLSDSSDEVKSGEWLSVADVRTLIDQLQAQLPKEELTHG